MKLYTTLFLHLFLHLTKLENSNNKAIYSILIFIYNVIHNKRRSNGNKIKPYIDIRVSKS